MARRPVKRKVPPHRSNRKPITKPKPHAPKPHALVERRHKQKHKRTTHYRRKPMAKKPVAEPEADVFEADTPTEPDQEEADTEAVIEPLAATSVDSHKANVVAATGTKQGAITSAYTTFASDRNQANLVANVKTADINFYKSLVTSAKANGQPFGAALEALKSLGVTGA